MTVGRRYTTSTDRATSSGGLVLEPLLDDRGQVHTEHGADSVRGPGRMGPDPNVGTLAISLDPRQGAVRLEALCAPVPTGRRICRQPRLGALLGHPGHESAVSSYTAVTRAQQVDGLGGRNGDCR